MFFNDISEIKDIIKKTSFSIFAISPELFPEIKNAICLRPPEDSKKITVDMIRDFSSHASACETSDKFFVVLNAETMNENAENAFLKNLEEPKDFCHFILVTKTPSVLLPTILSRAQIYYLKEKNVLSAPVNVDEETKTLAKKLITAKPTDLQKISAEISTKKDFTRQFALNVVSAAIEISYKSYFATNNQKFLQKLPNLISLYDNLNANGNIKLHIVADML